MMQYSLYISRWCPFCIRVMSALKSMDVKVAILDISDRQYFEELRKGGGKTQVPCLKIEKGDVVEWMYESEDIIRYLKQI